MRLRAALALLVVGVLGSGLAVDSEPGAQAPGAPVVRVASVRPILITAAGFAPREPVRLVVFGSRTATRHVTADLRGAFKSAFPALAPARCDAVAVRAIGKRGSNAAAIRAPRPGCLGLRRPAVDP